jgi:hypothetical protein
MALIPTPCLLGGGLLNYPQNNAFCRETAESREAGRGARALGLRKVVTTLEDSGGPVFIPFHDRYRK